MKSISLTNRTALALTLAGILPSTACAFETEISDSDSDAVISLKDQDEKESTSFRPEFFSIVNDYDAFYQSISVGADSDVTFDTFAAELNTAARIGGLEGFTIENSMEYNFESISDGSDEDISELRRNGTRLIYDLPDQAVRIQVGDVLSQPTNFQGIVDSVGVSVGTAYSELQPLKTIRTAGERILVLQRRSIVQIIEEGQLLDEVILPPGQYTPSDFPTALGSGSLELLVRDDQGRTGTIDFSGGDTAILLAPGITEYELTAGYQSSFGFDGINYDFDEFVSSGFIRTSLNSNLTAGADYQYTGIAQQVGVEVIRPLFGGAVRLGAATSHISETSAFGQALSVSQEWQSLFGDGFATLKATFYSDDFAIPGFVEVLTPSEQVEEEPDLPERELRESAVTTFLPFKSEFTADGGFSLNSITSISFSGSYRELRETDDLDLQHDDEWSASAGVSFNINRRARLSGFFSTFKEQGDIDQSIFVSLQVRFGQNTRAISRYQSSNRNLRTRFVRSPSRTIDDFSYNVGVDNRFDGTDISTFSADGSLFTNRADINFGTRQNISDPSGRSQEFTFADMSGSVLMTRDGVRLAKTGDGSSAFVVVKDAADDRQVYVDGYSDNGRVMNDYSARTDLFGSPVLSDALSYTENTLELVEFSRLLACVTGETEVETQSAYRTVTLAELLATEEEQVCLYEDDVSDE